MKNVAVGLVLSFRVQALLKCAVNCIYSVWLVILGFSTVPLYRVFSRDVTAAMLVSQNKEMATMLVSQTKPLGIELYFYANTFFCFSKPIWPVVT